MENLFFTQAGGRSQYVGVLVTGFEEFLVLPST